MEEWSNVPQDVTLQEKEKYADRTLRKKETLTRHSTWKVHGPRHPRHPRHPKVRLHGGIFSLESL